MALTNNLLKSRFEKIVTFMALEVNNTFFGNAPKSNNRGNFGVWRQNASKMCHVNSYNPVKTGITTNLEFKK